MRLTVSCCSGAGIAQENLRVTILAAVYVRTGRRGRARRFLRRPPMQDRFTAAAFIPNLLQGPINKASVETAKPGVLWLVPPPPLKGLLSAGSRSRNGRRIIDETMAQVWVASRLAGTVAVIEVAVTLGGREWSRSVGAPIDNAPPGWISRRDKTGAGQIQRKGCGVGSRQNLARWNSKLQRVGNWIDDKSESVERPLLVLPEWGFYRN